ncbi:hypothetical protein Pcinc_014695 [Petrolisthes cinctipes]|uniref:Uncharacterized protein n=1 Tax=Petrolisthes cinctipes TaxID=88211 RepID=A0AAE1KRI9_PETCI|nr:hypothetical protein Pcinc_014695 [Petrolisthes cinctipes]
MVGHSQIPQTLVVPDVDVQVFRAPGGRASSFFTDARLHRVLAWKHDLCILWLGSNDVIDDIDGIVPNELAKNIVEIIQTIERDCEAKVCVCLIEPREYPNEYPNTSVSYKKIKNAVNKTIRRKIKNEIIHFNTQTFANSLASDGVQFNDEGSRVENTFKKVIEGQKEKLLNSLQQLGLEVHKIPGFAIQPIRPDIEKNIRPDSK